jgi:hypothetical protein
MKCSSGLGKCLPFQTHESDGVFMPSLKLLFFNMLKGRRGRTMGGMDTGLLHRGDGRNSAETLGTRYHH